VGAWLILVTLDDDASDTLGDFTEAHIGQPMALVLDGEVISVPTIQARIEEEATLVGDFSASEAQDLARILNSHALPFSVQLTGVDSLP
jgi:preprotein translocase subunit SecD